MAYRVLTSDPSMTDQSPELWTQCMLELYQGYEVFNVSESYSSTQAYFDDMTADKDTKEAREDTYKLELFDEISRQFPTERNTLDDYMEKAKNTRGGIDEFKLLQASLGDMGQRYIKTHYFVLEIALPNTKTD